MMKEQGLEEEGGDDQEESPDQSISSAIPTDSGVGDGAPMSQDGKANVLWICYVIFVYWSKETNCWDDF